VSALDAPGVLEQLVAAWPSLQRPERVLLAREHPVCWAMLTSEGRWKPAKHLLYLARALMRFESGQSRRLIVSMPPRHGKTAFVWRHFGSWRLGKHPRSKVMGVTYQSRQACRWSKQARDDLAAFGPEVFGVGASKRSAAEEWPVLRAGQPTEGLMNALGMGGALTGKGADDLICDDLVSGVAATRNPAIREQAWEWTDQDLLSRFENPESCCALVGTRWHDDDIIGRILAAQERGEPPGGYPWEVINLPLLAGPDDPLGRAEGEALWPERWTQEWAERKRATTPPFSFSALYQGSPVPIGGGLFKRDQVQYYEDQGPDLVSPGARTPAASLVRILVVDLAFSIKTQADFTVLLPCGVDVQSGRVFVLEVVRKRLEPAQIGPEMRDVMARHGISRAYVERSGFKTDEMRIIRESFGLPIVEIQPNTDKLARALPASDYLATGKLLFRARAPWLGPLLAELLAFPNGDHDDQVDAVAHAVHVASRMQAPRRRPPPSGGEASWWNGMRGG
jgi:predicted phage terminase large subunit-like protein